MGIKAMQSSLWNLPINTTDLHLATGSGLMQIYTAGRLHFESCQKQSLKCWLNNLIWLSASETFTESHITWFYSDTFTASVLSQ